jgi:zinc/manganese transport system substrate-binding protein
MGVKEGGNPHMWYSPTYVHRVIDQVTSDLKKLDSNDSSYFDQQRSDYMSKGLANYERLQSDIKKRFANTPVGSTESIFAYLSKDIGLNLISPPAYMTAISEGTDPTAQDKATFDQQITQHQIKVLVFNKQNSTPDVNALVQKAKDQKISVVSITETLEPAGASFQQWQSAQLQALDTTLAQASA